MHFNDFYLPRLGSQFRRQDKLDTGQSWAAPGSSQDHVDILDHRKILDICGRFNKNEYPEIYTTTS